MWTYRGQRRPDFAIEPGPAQESVWDYPRPPALRPDSRRVTVHHDGVLVADSARASRVCETASPPTFYLPPEDVLFEHLVPAGGSSWCEWKGEARYWAPAADPAGPPIGWSYPSPTPAFEGIRDWLSFYPGRLDARVDGIRVDPQPGGFYGGWITPEIVGPCKGEPGTGGW